MINGTLWPSCWWYIRMVSPHITQTTYTLRTRSYCTAHTTHTQRTYCAHTMHNCGHLRAACAHPWNVLRKQQKTSARILRTLRRWLNKVFPETAHYFVLYNTVTAHTYAHPCAHSLVESERNCAHIRHTLRAPWYCATHHCAPLRTTAHIPALNCAPLRTTAHLRNTTHKHYAFAASVTPPVKSDVKVLDRPFPPHLVPPPPGTPPPPMKANLL